MQRRTVRIIGSIVLALLTVASVIFVIVPSVIAFQNPSELVSVNANNANLQTKLNGLKQTQAQYPKLQKIAAQLEKQFPAAANVPQVTGIVANAANDAGLNSGNVTSLTFASPVVVKPTTAAAGAAAGGAAASAPAATPAPSAAAEATTGSSAAANSSSGGYATQAIQIVVNGGGPGRYATFIRSLTNSSQNGRVFTVNNFSVGGASNGSGNSLTVNLTAYLHEPIPSVSAGSATGSVQGASPAPSATPVR